MNGITKSKFGSEKKPVMQVMLLFDKLNKEHKEFVDLFNSLEELFSKEVHPRNIYKCIKDSTYEENGMVMYAKLECKEVDEGKLGIYTKMEGFSNDCDFRDTFTMTGTLKLSGLYPSPMGLSFMKRISYIKREEDAIKPCVVVDLNTDQITFQGTDITSTASMTHSLKRSPSKEDLLNGQSPTSKKLCKADPDT